MDTAAIDDIRTAARWGVLDGVTTNPTLFAKVGGSYDDVLREICAITPGPVSAAVVAADVDGMLREGRHFATLAPNIVVKIPMSEEGLEAIAKLKADGIKTNCTLIFSANQGLLAAKAGASLLSPFVGRLDDINEDGMIVVRELVTIVDTYDLDAEVLAASIRQGTVTASLILRKLGAYPRQNALAVALRELGRLERTLFLLQYICDVELRRRIHVGLNKGEARNALAKAVFFNRLGELRDRTHEDQRHRASGLNLLVAAIVLWNTVYLERAVKALHERGEVVPDDLVAHLSPLGWEHINLTGDYVWRRDRKVEKGNFRPLRPFPKPHRALYSVS
jgi:TalC/MipB family fructose-6-phosphate aldolase